MRKTKAIALTPQMPAFGFDPSVTQSNDDRPPQKPPH